jgi:epoxide hydrolase 4
MRAPASGPAPLAPPGIEQFDAALPHGMVLSCRAAGAVGRPVLLFLHGFPEAAFVWDDVLRHFAQPEHGGYRCVAPNLRGFERSSSPADVAAYRAKHLMQDVVALIEQTTAASPTPGRLAALVAHDWGGAVAWNVAATAGRHMERLAIINSPHPGTFLRELQHSPAQQAASAYMNALAGPEAEARLAANDFQKMWGFFASEWGGPTPEAWLTPEVKQQYRDVWNLGLTGGLNYYRASPLRPPTEADAGAQAVTLPPHLLRVELPTLVIWGEQDRALLPGLLDGLASYVPRLQVERLPDASHWVIHEQPERVCALLEAFLAQPA